MVREIESINKKADYEPSNLDISDIRLYYITLDAFIYEEVIL